MTDDTDRSRLDAEGDAAADFLEELLDILAMDGDIDISVEAGRAKVAIVDSISVFDVYRGKGIENGKKGLAFRVLLQDTQKTLTDAEVDEALAGLRRVLEQEYGAKLRQ